MKIAIEGCCHGELDVIYSSVQNLERVEGVKIDLLLICGDFQSIRNTADMECLACPAKYREIGFFYKYYSGQKSAPYPTVFIGGNHEASNYLWELYHGGWVCDNIYFLGFGGVINFGGLRIAGISGIYKHNHYNLGHYEKSPYSDSDIRSVYHVREYDVFKLSQIKKPVDIFLSHDWPRGVEKYGDLHSLLSRKPFFRAEVERNAFGSIANELLLTRLRPSYWFAAHLHVKYAALIDHNASLAPQPIPPTQGNQAFFAGNSDEIHIDDTIDDDDDQGVGGEGAQNPDEIQIDLDEDAEGDGLEPQATGVEGGAGANPDEIVIDHAIVEEGDGDVGVSAPAEIGELPTQPEIPTDSQPTQPVDSVDTITETATSSSPAATLPSLTRFLGLDKCLRNRDFLQMVDIPMVNGPLEFSYDVEWLAITKVAHQYLSLSRNQAPLPEETAFRSEVEETIASLQTRVNSGELDLRIPLNFQPTAEAHNPAAPLYGHAKATAQRPFLNPQTETLCALLDIENKINVGGQPPVPVPEPQEEEQELTGSENDAQVPMIMEPELIAYRDDAQVLAMEPEKRHENEEEYDPTEPFIVEPPLAKRSRMSLPPPRAVEAEIGTEEAAMDVASAGWMGEAV